MTNRFSSAQVQSVNHGHRFTLPLKQWTTVAAHLCGFVAALLALEALLYRMDLIDPRFAWGLVAVDSAAWMGTTPATASVVALLLYTSFVLSGARAGNDSRRKTWPVVADRFSAAFALVALLLCAMRAVDVFVQEVRGGALATGPFQVGGGFFLEWLLVPATVAAQGSLSSMTFVTSVAFGLLAYSQWMLRARGTSSANLHRRAWAVAAAAIIMLLALGSVPLDPIDIEVNHQPWSPCPRTSVMALLLAGGLGLRIISQREPGTAQWRNLLKPLLTSALIFVIGVAVTRIMASQALHVENAAAQARFERDSLRVNAEVRRRCELPLAMLHALRGLFIASKSVERLEFRAFVDSWNLRQQFPGCVGFGFVERVAPQELDSYVERQRADSAPEFVVQNLGTNMLPSDAHWIVSFVTPLAANTRVRGYDLSTRPKRHSHLERAARTGEFVVTPRVDLIQTLEPNACMLYMLPVYRVAADLSTETSRLEALLGVVYAAVRVDELFAGVVQIVDGEIEFAVMKDQRDDDEMPPRTDENRATAAAAELVFAHPNEGFSTAPAAQSAQPATALTRPSPFLLTTPLLLGLEEWQVETRSPLRSLRTTSATEWLTATGSALTLMTAIAVFVSLWMRERNRELRALSVELRDTTERAHRVVDDVSHEFRTPLTVIKEFGALIREGVAGSVSPTQTEYLTFLDDAATDLNHLIEDLLDSSKLRVGRLRVDRQSTDVATIFARVETEFRRRAEVRGLALTIVIEPGLGRVFADEEKVRRVISNLMSNAIKFSKEHGTIELSARGSKRCGEVVIGVRDEGRGFTPLEIAGLFRRFQTRAAPSDRSTKNFGLGLAIAQELVNINLGKMSVRSEAGKGALLSFTLPTADLAAVLACFFQSTRSDATVDEPLVLLAAEASTDELDASGAARIKLGHELHAFLTSVTHPSDIVLDDSRGVDKHEDAMSPRAATATCFLLGRSARAEDWVQRLNQARSEQEAARGKTLGAFRVEVIATWRYPRHAALAQAEVAQFLEGRCAEAQFVPHQDPIATKL